jgi:hypothetical protein
VRTAEKFKSISFAKRRVRIASSQRIDELQNALNTKTGGGFPVEPLAQIRLKTREMAQSAKHERTHSHPI